MGVFGLMRFVYVDMPFGSKVNIDILNEVEDFKKKTKIAEPVIDFLDIIDAFGKNHNDFLCGGQHNIYLEAADIFFSKLKKENVQISIFINSRLQSAQLDNWPQKSTNAYGLFDTILRLIDKGQQPIMNQRDVSCIDTAAESIKRVARRHGATIEYGKTDADIVKYAIERNALAIISSDSNYFIFDGEFQFWHGRMIQFDTMKTYRLGRKQLRDHLNLSVSQMRIFACIMGNEQFNGHWRTFFSEVRAKRVASIANYIKSLGNLPVNCAIDFSYCTRVALDVFDDFSLTKSIMDAANNYLITTKSDTKPKQVINLSDKLMEYCADNLMMKAILSNGIIKFDVTLIDFMSPKNLNYAKSIQKVIKRLAGILLQSQSDKSPKFQMITKTSNSKDYTLLQHKPIYATVKIPPLEHFIFDETFDNNKLKWELIIWSLTLKQLTDKQIDSIEPGFLIILLALKFLVQKKFISIFEADAILLSEYNVAFELVQPLEAKEPSALDGRAIRVAQLYNRTTMLVWDCLFICGMSCNITDFRFNGFHFHHIFKLSFLTEEELLKINDLRLYDVDDTELASMMGHVKA